MIDINFNWYSINNNILNKYSDYEYISLDKCPVAVFITSTGLTKTHHSSKLGKYHEDGVSNGHISYKNNAGYFLHFEPGGSWIVSSKYNILIASYVKRVDVHLSFYSLGV